MPLRWLLLLAPLCACRMELGAPAAAAPRTGAPRGEVRVCTSIYREVIDVLDPVLEAAVPGVSVEWFQGGSEKVAARLDAELAAGQTSCDLLLTSDPATYARLAREGRFLVHVAPAELRHPRELFDPDGRYGLARISAMAIAYDPEAFRDRPPPARIADLADPSLRGRVAIGDPLQSGTAFTTVALLEGSGRGGLLDALAGNQAIVAGGNSAVLARIEGREAAAGLVLLENVLAAQRGGSRLRAVLPGDGVPLVPGNVAILAASHDPASAAAVYDALLAPAAQELMARPGSMHAADPRVPPPAGAPPLPELMSRAIPWNEGTALAASTGAAAIKDRFERRFRR
jgi:iron(III) transport system substrate-binding protein